MAGPYGSNAIFGCLMGQLCGVYGLRGRQLDNSDTLTVKELGRCGASTGTLNWFAITAQTESWDGPVVYGRSGVSENNGTDFEWGFLSKRAQISGEDQIPAPKSGAFTLCWCRGGSERAPCNMVLDYRTAATQLNVYGPDEGKTFPCIKDTSCSMSFTGLGIGLNDYARVAPEEKKCADFLKETAVGQVSYLPQADPSGYMRMEKACVNGDAETIHMIPAHRRSLR